MPHPRQHQEHRSVAGQERRSTAMRSRAHMASHARLRSDLPRFRNDILRSSCPEGRPGTSEQSDAEWARSMLLQRFNHNLMHKALFCTRCRFHVPTLAESWPQMSLAINTAARSRRRLGGEFHGCREPAFGRPRYRTGEMPVQPFDVAADLEVAALGQRQKIGSAVPPRRSSANLGPVPS